ncbi:MULTISPECIES: hypothetical protein [unclassified Rhizobium]|uniref:hypothetical protein n=1 Tax=unclassified Rhizobium TaxID=2613769 RepID=UPI00105214E1|nr:MULTISPECIES: hypothetical protein [unclassified Rhizobium]MBB3394205.1 hypothetical protein [Rhizobium sp. BK060]MBB4169700.1 hypothetical protein [Rhizobium sp. BK538]TCM65160.1 hypothetical protein EV291_14337 [Rhizobium sp. BK068]
MALIPSKAEVEALSAETDASYLQRKIIGGGSGRNGVVFELRFIAFRVLEEVLFAKKANADFSTVKFGVQVRSYIDDFVVARGNEVNWYEIKSGEATEWDEGRHTIADNFLSQYLLDHGRRLKAKYNLVVPTQERKSHLDDMADHRTKGVVLVVIFPNTGNVDDIEIEYPWFPNDLSKLIPLDAARRDLEDLYVGLQATALNFPNNEIRDLAFVAEQLSRKYKGAFTCVPDQRLDPRAEAIILAVPGMTVAVCGDQLHYKCTNPEVRGRVLGCRIGSASGQAFEEEIIARRPKTWKRLSPLLGRNYGGA